MRYEEAKTHRRHRRSNAPTAYAYRCLAPTSVIRDDGY